MEKMERNMEFPKAGLQPIRNLLFDASVNDLKLNILLSGYTRCTPQWHIRQCATPFCRLYIVQAGEGILQTEAQTLHMEPGTAYLLPPEVPVSYSCPTYLLKLFFHLELLSPDHYDLFYRHPQILRIRLSRLELEELIELYRSGSYYSCLKLKQSLYALLLRLYQQIPLSGAQLPAYSPHVRDTLRYIHQNLSAQLSVEELAKRRFISHTTLNRLFRAELGMTVGQYIDDQLLMQAKALLCHTTRSIAEVSAQLGFSDQFYFSKKFKSASGFAPLQYRKTHSPSSRF